ncbi:MAG: hypothetical protein Q8N60_04600 [Candidatus Diapherotrites archaeon]|nr:hypothetical protein [Candidatus Diapherotrites archaeon]
MKANVIAIISFFLILTNAASALPEYCPNVTIESGNIVVDGEPFFPIGFWGMYNYPATIDLAGMEYNKYFNAIMGDSNFQFDYIESQASQGKVKMFSQSALYDALAPRKVAERYENSNVIGWEMLGEPNYYANYTDGAWQYTRVDADVLQVSNIIKANDPCDRLVSVTPSISAAVYNPYHGGNYLGDHARFVDLVIVQAAYRVPPLDVKTVGEHIRAARNLGNKPVILAMRIEGFHPKRIRLYFREPTAEEMRVQAYDAIINGAKGVLLYSFSKTASDRTAEERDDSRGSWAAFYKLTDSPKQFEKIKEFALDLKRNEKIFLSPFSSTASVNSPPGIDCAAWDASEDQRTANYAICANVAEETSQYFGYTSGGANLHLDAHFIDRTTGGTFPTIQCNDGIDNDLDGLVDTADLSDCSSEEDDIEGPDIQNKIIELSTSKLYIATITNGITFDNSTVNKFDLNFVEVPSVGADFKYAVYSDGARGYVNPNPEYDPHFDLSRDLTPDTKIFEGTAHVDSAGIQEFEFVDSAGTPHPIELEHTRTYFLVIHMQSENVKMGGKDVRTGALSKEGNTSFLDLTEQAPVLRKGKTFQATISFSGITANKYCVQKELGTGLELKDLQSSRIDETFGPYAVHIYKFADYIGNEICDSLDNDCDDEIDEGNVCQTNCNNNGTCETGETFENCPQDCPPECIREPQLLGFIGQWKRGEMSMLVLMQKIRQRNTGEGCPPA